MNQQRTLRVVVAPDSFKESAEASVAARAIARGVRRALPLAEIVEIPLADGGEGTAALLAAATGGRMIERPVTGPLGEPVRARYAILGDGATAVIEMAEAAGLHLVPPGRRDPRLTTTRGVGELMADALGRGLRRIVIGLGGSATNDAGAGLAQALGYALRDAAGRELPPGGAALACLAAIDPAGRHPALDGCEVLAACDVNHLLCGPRGASRTFGPQKGAGPEAVEELDAALLHFAQVVASQLGISLLDLPGGGAAGGLGAGLVAFAAARLRPGFEIVAEACALERHLQGADLALTGEGRCDGQSAGGKVPAGVARLALRAGVPLVVLAGSLGEGYEALYDLGVRAVFSICSGPLTLEEAMARTEPLLEAAAESVTRLWLAGRGVSAPTPAAGMGDACNQEKNV